MSFTRAFSVCGPELRWSWHLEKQQVVHCVARHEISNLRGAFWAQARPLLPVHHSSQVSPLRRAVSPKRLPLASHFLRQRKMENVEPAATASSNASAIEDSEKSTEDKAVIFTTPACPYCRRAKRRLQSEGVPYKEVDVGSNAAVRSAVVEATGHRTVPVIFINGEYLGGSDTLDEVADAGKLPSLLAAAAKELPEGIRSAMAKSDEGGTKRDEPASSASQLADADRLEKLEEIAARMGARANNGGIPREAVRKGLAKIQNIFSGADAVAWLLANVADVKDKASAVVLGRQLQNAGLLHHATFSGPFTGNKEDLFRLHCDEPTNSKAFNAGTVWIKPTRPATEVAENLRSRILALYDAAVSSDGRSVNYTSLAKTPEFAQYVAATGQLQRVDLFALSSPEKMAFFINLYNSLVIHAMVEGRTPTSLLDRVAFYRSSKYLVGGHEYSLDDMENGVLRGNRPPASSLTGARAFGPTDPRRFHALPVVDARIHFALNCGAKSCPPIKLYTADNLDEALRGAAEAFVEGDLEVSVDKGVVTVSKIFDWYKIDFGSTPEERLAWIRQFVMGSRGQEVDKLLAKGKVTLEHRKYDWSLND